MIDEKQVKLINIKKKLLDLKLEDQQYNAMLLSYLLRLASFELTRKKINAEMAEKPEVSDEDMSKLEGIESLISDTIQMIDSAIFTPCLINYLRKYDPDKLDYIDKEKGKIIVDLNKVAKEGIEQEVKFFGLGEVKDDKIK